MQRDSEELIVRRRMREVRNLRPVAAAPFILFLLCLAACEKLLPEEFLGMELRPPEAKATPVPTSTPRPQPTATARPQPTPTVPPQPTEPPDTPTPEPDPVAMGQYTRGSAVVHIGGINRLPLNRRTDYIVASTFTWELSGSDKRAPILELSIRGTRPRACQERPCGDDAGLVVRVTANAAYDGNMHDESRHCGSGTNYHLRLAIGPLDSRGGVDVVLDWDESGLRASTPVDSVFLPTKVPGSFGFGRFLEGAPFGHGERGYGWDTLSIQRNGGSATLQSFGGEGSRLRGCP